jgi:hypothetical protein
MYRLTELKRLAESYLKAHPGLSAHALSIQICGRSNNVIIGRLIAGHKVSGPNLEVLSDFFDGHWPQNVAWPEGIARNGATKEAAE